VAIQGSDSSCSLHIPRVTLGDHGNFLCLLNQAETFRTARSSVDLEVATEAGLSLRRRGSGESGVLEAVDGELVEVECRAVRAHPAPTLQWVVPGGVEEGAVVEEVEEAEGHTVTLVSRLTYRASSSHSSASIQCLSTQVNPSGGDILYSDSANITLSIAQAAPLISIPIEGQLGILSAVLIACALVFTTILVLIIFIIKKKRKETSTPSPLSSPPPTKAWRHNPIWTTAETRMDPYPQTQGSKDDNPFTVEVHNSSTSSATSEATSSSSATSSSYEANRSLGDLAAGHYASLSPTLMYHQDTVGADVDILTQGDTEAPNSLFHCPHGCFGPDHPSPKCGQHSSPSSPPSYIYSSFTEDTEF
jgi:hypothetical protein